MDRRTFLRSAGAGLLILPAWLRAFAAPIAVSNAGLIFVQAEVTGRSAKALIDTGGSRGIQLSEALAEALGLALADTGRTMQRYDGAHPIRAARLATLDVAGTVSHDVEATVSPGDIENIGRQIGEPFDVILGWPLLGARPFVIDYAARSFEWREETGSGGLILPLEAGRPQPVTAGHLGDSAITFLIDTGAPFCSVDSSLAGAAAPGSRVELQFELGGQSHSAPFRVRDLAAMTRGLGARAVIGHQFLQRYRFVWRREERAIHLA